MNIAMFAWEALEGLSVGGGAVYASRLAAALAAAGHRVRLFTRLGPGQAMEEVVGGIHVSRCPWDKKPGFYEEIEGLSQSFLHYFTDAMKSDGVYDVVHCHEWFTIGAGLGASNLIPATFAVSFHSTEWGRTGVWPDKGDSARIAGLERQGIDRADAVVAASHWARRTIHEQFHPPDWKCEVVYHGGDMPARELDARRIGELKQSLGIPSDAPSFLFAGRFSAAGGADLAARAARLVAGRHPNAKFVFIGAGPLEQEMRGELGDAGVFLPLRGRVVPSEYYQAVDLVLAPFRRDHNGRAVLPAWAAAKPVMVLENTVPSEFVMDGVNGWIAKADPVEIAAHVMNAFNNPPQTQWLGRNGRVAMETAFTWGESANRLMGAYARRMRLTPEKKA